MVKSIQQQVNMSSSGNITIDEASLVAQAKSGSMIAAERLVLRYQDRVYNTILKICGNSDDAAELCQDVFVKAIMALKNFRSQSSFYTWLFRIAVNHTYNFCQRNKKVTFESLQSQSGQGSHKQLKDFLADQSTPDPAVIVSNREIHRLVLEAVDRLDIDQRVVVVLRDVEQMNYAEIAETLKIEIGTVKSRISRGRKKLKEVLEAILQ